MHYLLTCTCGREHTVTSSQAGEEIQCECGETLRVPTLRGLAELPLASQAHAASRVGRSSITWGGWRGPALAVSMAGMIIALLCAGWFLLQRSLIDTSYTAETEMAAVDEYFDQFSAEELSLAWNNFQELGIGQKKHPDYFLWNVYAKQREKFALVSGAVALAFGVVAAGIWVSARSA